MTNILKKYTSNPIVFCLESQEIYKKDDVVKYLTKYGKEIELIIYKLIFSKNGLNYYSYLRADGKNRKTILENKIEKRKDWAEARENKSNQYFKASKEGADFLALAEPIKILSVFLNFFIKVLALFTMFLSNMSFLIVVLSIRSSRISEINGNNTDVATNFWFIVMFLLVIFFIFIVT